MNFITPFKNISTNVVVDIKENYINIIKDQEDYIDYLIDNLYDANYKVNKENIEIKETINKTTKENRELINEVNSKTNLLNDIKGKREVIKDEKVVKQSFNIIILLIVLTVIYIISRITNKKVAKK